MSAVEAFPDAFKRSLQPMVDSQWQASGAAMEQFWQAQERTLDAMESFMIGWFRRRHEGAREAIRLVRDITESEDAMEAATCVQEWMQESIGRMVGDFEAAGQDLRRLLDDLQKPGPVPNRRSRN